MALSISAEPPEMVPLGRDLLIVLNGPYQIHIKDCHFCECWAPDEPSKGCHCECHE